MSENRADSFLRLIRRSQRGKLKIYLGYCAGVGKTYQMLQEAQRLRNEGVHIIAGFVETHGRKETEALLTGLELVPRLKIKYHDIVIEEMDLTAILRQKPDVVLVDELAHTNVPGLKYAKRYQDVEELLAAGIHVISTLNVQHLESLYETVERVTGIKVRERIPDRIIAEADQIVNVDVTTVDLQRRLRDGKVYTVERVESALENFFKSANLEQLRELTLRELAAQIDARRRDSPAEPVSTSPDQVMVCLSSKSPNAAGLLRYASRLAGRLNRNWYVVNVQTTSERPTVIDASVQRALHNTLELAHQLGATVFTYKGDDVVKTILSFAQEYRVGHIIIGSSGKKLAFWKRAIGETGIIERLIAESRGITVVVVDTRLSEQKQIDSETLTAAGPEGEAVAQKTETLLSLPIESSRVVIWPEAIDKETGLMELVRLCCDRHPDLFQSAMKAFLQREELGSTFLGEDLALPHARLAELPAPLVSIGIARKGMTGPDASYNKARILIMILSPAQDPEQHLRLLSEISKLAVDDRWHDGMIHATKTTEVVQFFV